MRLSEDNGAQAFYVFGEHKAFGVSPFSIENGNEDGKLRKAYEKLTLLTPLLAKEQNRHGMLFENKDEEKVWNEDGLRITARHFFTLPWDSRATDGSTWPLAGAMLIRIAEYEYILAGSGVVLTLGRRRGGCLRQGASQAGRGRVRRLRLRRQCRQCQVVCQVSCRHRERR